MSWKRKLGGIGIVLGTFIVTLGLAGYLLLRSQGFHGYVLSKIQQQASEAMGAQVHIQNFSLHLGRLGAEAYGITIRGGEPTSAPPLVEADQLMIRLKIVSLLHNKVDLNEIVLRQPVVNLMVRKDGSTNLPTPPKSNTNSSTSPFDLGIQHVLIERGEIYYNDVETPLDAELHDLQLEVKSEFLKNGYDGRLSYRSGRLQYGDMKPLPHDLTASFNATPSQFMLKPLLLTVASSTIRLEGDVKDFAHPSAKGTYQIAIHPQDFSAVLKDPAVPTGEITLAGSLRYDYQTDAPMLRAVVLDGHLNSRELAINSPDLRAVIRNVGGEFKLLNGNLDAHGLEAELLGGRLTASATMQHLDANSVSKLHASLQGISLGAAKAAFPTASLKQIPISGHIDGTSDAGWTGSVKDIRARSTIALKAALANPSAGSAPIPLDGALHLDYEGRSGVATLTNTFVRTPRTRVDINGTAGQRLNLRAQVHAADLREMDSLAAAFQTTGSNPTNSPSRTSINLAGIADLEVLVEGRMNDPRIAARLNGQNLEVENTQWRSLELGLRASKSGVSVENGALVNARQGYINFSLNTGLSNWHYIPSSPVSARVMSRELAIKQLLEIAKLDYPVSGNLAIDLSMHGSQLSPMGSGSVRLAQANIYGQRLQQLSIDFQGEGNSLTSSLNVSMPAGSAKANLVFYPQNKGYELQLDCPGVKLAQLQPVQERNLGIGGILTMSASGRGTLDDPQLTTTVQIPQLQIREAKISGIKADLNVANHRADLALNSEIAQSFVEARGSLDLTGEHYMRATLDTKGMPIEGLLALYAPAKSNGPHGVLEVHASAQGPIGDKTHMRAQVVIPTLKVDYQGLQIGNTRAIRILYANSIIALDPTEIAGTDTSLRLEGQLPLEGVSPVTLSAVGTVDMQLLRFFQSDLQSSGKLLLDVRGTGATAHPALQGQIRLQNISMMTPDAPLGLQNLNGVLDISNDQVNISQLAGEAGGGQLSARHDRGAKHCIRRQR